MLSSPRPQETSGLAIGAVLDDSKVKPDASNFLGEIAGKAGSQEALKRLTAEISEQKRSAARPALLKATRAVNAGDYITARNLAMEGLKRDEQSGLGWYLLGMALEIGGDFGGSIQAYEAALKLLPNHEDVANDLGRLALRLGMHKQAEKLFRHHLEAWPGRVEAINNLGTCLREMNRYDEAIEVIRPAIMENPNSAELWNTMGTIMGDMGDLTNARTFFHEAVRLKPELHRAHHNLANMELLAGDAEASLRHADFALAGATLPSDRVMMRMARFNALVGLRRLPEGWDEYETRLDAQFSGGTVFALSGRRWTPDYDIRGKTLMVIGEQGLGDEILFAGVLPQVIEDLGPDGKLVIVVERRLVDFFKQSFPQATVARHQTGMVAGRPTRIPLIDDMSDIDLWVPMASLMRKYRTTYESFDTPAGYMRADPEKVAHWRSVLETAPKGPKVGLLWKSASTSGARHRFYSPLDAWAPVLKTPGVTFVNLQYGDCADDLAYVKREFGVDIWDPPNVDLKQDLDDVAALCSSVDQVIGFSNATFNMAAACGVPVWLLASVGAWPLLGLKGRYAWYPQAEVFLPDEFGDWVTPMNRVAQRLQSWAAERQAA